MPFAAFPHQINDPVKLRRALRITKELLDSGRNIDDQSLGYTLFSRGIIRSRGYSGTRRQQLAQIQREPLAEQSPLRIARDLRRFFRLFGFIQDTQGEYSITKRGQVLLRASGPRLTKAERRAWFEGLLELKLRFGSSSFNPFKGMLQMLAAGPLQTKALALAFSQTSSSRAETRRLLQVARRIASGRSTLSRELNRTGISAPNANNSVKILPALMEHVGLIKRKARMTSLTSFGRTILDKETRHANVLPSETARRLMTQRGPWFRIIGRDDDLSVRWKPLDFEEGEVEYDPENEKERATLLKERTDIHQATLERMRRSLESRWRLAKGNFDLLAEKGRHALLIEVKSIKRGGARDERLRIIDGIGKLFFYERFDVPSVLKNREAKVQKVMLFSRKPNRDEHVKFLKKLRIWPLWFDDRDHLAGERDSSRAMSRLL